LGQYLSTLSETLAGYTQSLLVKNNYDVLEFTQIYYKKMVKTYS